jgi:hypothetical protein
MKQTRHPNFILGLISLLMLIVGVAMRANGYRPGDYILIATMVLGAIHWIWSIIDVFRGHPERGSETPLLWIILVIAIPPVGGLLYYSMNRKRETSFAERERRV